MSSKARKSLRASTMYAPQCRRQSVIKNALLLLSLAIRSACPFTIVALVSRSRSDSGVRTVQTLDREDVALFAGASRKKTSASAEETTTGSITLHSLSIFEKRWLGRLEELKKYGEKYGTYHVPRNCAEEYKKLEAWVRTQRYHHRLYQDGKPSLMNEERISALEDIGFQWEPSETLWEKHFNELVQYEAAHGDCNVPSEWKENPQLADWVRKQRRQYSRLQAGKKSSMTASHISKLEEIGFSWDGTFVTSWNKRYDELVKYNGMHGNCDVPQKSKEYPQLGRWVDVQRRNYRLRKEGKPNHMTDDRIKKLESIGFSWRLAIRPAWELRFQELVEYEAEHGHCNVPFGWKENPQLATWVKGQRQAYQDRRKGKSMRMTDERINKLESIGFKWVVQTVSWETRFQELMEYDATYGNCDVPYGWEENRQLANWVKHQRQQYRLLQEGKKSSMTDDRISKLEDIGFNWHPKRAESNNDG